MYTNLKSLKRWLWVLIAVMTLVVPAQAQNSVAGNRPTAAVAILDSTKEQDGLVGSVRRVKVETAKLELKSGRHLEGPRQLMEITTYSLSGNRIDNASYPIAHSSVGKEEYKYNDRGNIIEMTLRGDNGSILSRENYEYEFDNFGNWRKMVTSLILFENGELRHEPVEVTYREIAYYFDDSVAKMVKPISRSMVLPKASPRFPEQITPVPEIPPDRLSISARPVLLNVNDEPPELPKLAKNERGARTRSHTESDKARETKAGAAAIFSTPANDNLAGVTKGTVKNSKETANSLSSARKSAIAHYEKGREYFGLGVLEEAVDSYQRSLELEPSAEVYLSLGHAYLRLKKDQEAGKAFKQATLLNPEISEAHYGLGLHYFGMGRYKNAADAFKRATHLRPDMAKAHYGLALSYQEMGKLDDLIAQFRILEALDPGLAKKLSDSFPEFNLPCRVAAFCR
ncbi:hypothetical protein BH18ACI4_BH18ACI4_12120 [soil metagenome]